MPPASCVSSPLIDLAYLFWSVATKVCMFVKDFSRPPGHPKTNRVQRATLVIPGLHASAAAGDSSESAGEKIPHQMGGNGAHRKPMLLVLATLGSGLLGSWSHSDSVPGGRACPRAYSSSGPESAAEDWEVIYGLRCVPGPEFWHVWLESRRSCRGS